MLLGFAFGEMLIHFLEHGLGGVARAGERSAGVGAEAGAHVATAAHAFEVSADFFGALRIADLRGDERGGGENQERECKGDAFDKTDLRGRKPPESVARRTDG